MNQDGDMTISELAKKANVNVQTIRYYESLKLLPPPKRSPSGYRLYTLDYLQNIRFIKNAQKLGFSLEEIGKLVLLRFDGTSMGAEVKSLIKDKVSLLEDEIHNLQLTKKYLDELQSNCSGTMGTADCPIIGALSAENLPIDVNLSKIGSK